MTKRTCTGLIVGCMLGFIVQGCAPSGNAIGSSGNAQTYAKDYETMKGIIQRVIKGSNLNIDAVTESKEEDRINIMISKNTYVANESVRQDQGRVIVQAMGEQESSVEVENPEYHFSVPRHQREDYRRIIFSRLENYTE